jgi:hypothetical protein
VLKPQKNVDSSNVRFLAFGLIAGLNVDNFIKKIENIAEITEEISNSRV